MSARYRDYGYATPEHGSGAAGHALAREYVSLVSGLKDISTVCDLGCGNGYLASQFGKAGYRVTGLDASSTGIEVARRHYEKENVTFVLADLDDPSLALATGPFDVVVSSDVIEHLYRPAALMEIAARILKASGYLVVGTPYHGYLKNLAIAVVGKWDAHHNPNWDGGHIKFFSVSSLRELVERCGFETIRFRFHGRAPLLWKNMICVARKRGG